MGPWRVSGRSARDALQRARLRCRVDARLSPRERFTRDGGDRLRTLNLGLDPDSVVLDLGAYQGDYAADLRRLYDCTVHVFEPIPKYAERIRERFAKDSKVVLHEYAVGSATGVLTLHVSEDASGAFIDQGESITVPVRAVAEVMPELPPRISIAKLNIEGGEFDLLPAMYEAGMTDAIDQYFIQFHAVSPTSPRDRAFCQALLAETHVQTWDYPFVWEAWGRPWGYQRSVTA